MNQYRSDEKMLIEEDDYFRVIEEFEDDRIFVLIIYDIVDNKRRLKFAKFLLSYGFRVQKSAFEAFVSHYKCKRLIERIPLFVAKGDSIRLYKLTGKGQVMAWGEESPMDLEEIVVI